MDSLKTFASAKIKKIIAAASLGIQTLFAIIFIFSGYIDYQDDSHPLYGVYNSSNFQNSSMIGEIIAISIVIIVVIVLLCILGVGIYRAIVRKKMLYQQSIVVGLSFALLIFGAISGYISVLLPILILLVAALTLAYLIFFYQTNKEESKIESERAKDGYFPSPKEAKEAKDVNLRGGVLPTIILIFVGLAATFLVFVLPVCKFDRQPVFKLFDVFGSSRNEIIYLEDFSADIIIPLIVLISFAIFFFAFVWLVLDTSKVLTYSKNNPAKFYKLARKNLYSSFAITICYFIFSILIEFVLFKQLSYPELTETSNISFIPLIVMSVVIIVQSILTSRYTKDESKVTHKRKVNRLITLAFTLAFVAILVASVLTDILIIEPSGSGFIVEKIPTVNGLQILKDAKEIDAEAAYLQLFSFVIYIVLVVAAVIVVLTVSTFIRGSKYFYKTSLISVITCFMCVFGITLFSKYFAIAQEVNKELIRKITLFYCQEISGLDFETKISSHTDIFLFIGLGLFGLLAIFRPYSQQIKEEGLDVNINDLDELGEALSSAGGGGGAGGGVGLSREDVAEGKSKDFDACPAFSEIDGEEAEIIQDVEERRKMLFNNPSLPSLVRFIVDYARESRLHLSYKEEDIAQFVAGLGSSKLSILQGMSGTGKTSLPKIFSEAILGNVNIIEVESSWKDKNELIGYFNEFSGKFTPKKFTQSLYRAAFYSDVITFIVLDEMNLSRIEYYFSDFLSLMENEPDKREIKLLNVQLKNFKGGMNQGYKQLKRGHTLKVSPNIWFIGTANRDESTFEISDKVYDRAMTMNFMKRAPKIDTYSDPIDQRFLDYETFNGLLEKACNSFKFNCSEDPTIKAVERLLAPYNISFGNRIERQIEKFVSVYCSCFVDSAKMIPVAVEKILFSKVVAKLEFKSVENKEELAHSFEELGLLECASFINKLNGDL